MIETNNLIITTLLVLTATPVSRANSGNLITPVSKLIIDTDAGGDDAIAILMAVEAERLDGHPMIIGITCVNGNAHVDAVALNVLKTLKVVDRLDIPVYKGAAHPLLRSDTKDEFYGTDGFGGIYYPDPPSTDLIQEEHAVNAMIMLVKAHPDEITLVALGPLTNIALAIRLYPSFLDELQQLIILGGSTEGFGIEKPGIEFNFLADPAANFIVFNSSTSRPTTLIPFETGERSAYRLVPEQSSNRPNNTKIWLMESINATFSNPEEFWYCQDSIAMAVALTSGSIVNDSKTYYSETIYEGTETAGMIIVDYWNITGNLANTNLIRDIKTDDYEQLLARYIEAE